MEIVPSTYLAFAAILVLGVVGPYRALWAFVGLAPFGAAAAFNLPAVGGATIGQLELVICALLLMVMLRPGGPDRILGTLRPGQAGFWLLLLIVYCVISALFFPRVFTGMSDIFSLSRAVNEDAIISIPLRPSSGNISQTFLLMLSCTCYLALATLYRARPDEGAVLRAMIVCTTVNFVLGWLDILTGAIGRQDMMEWIRTANYDMAINQTMAGLKRMVGGMPEPSTFGAFSLGLLGFWMHYWIISPRSRATTAMLVMAVICVLRSTSSGAYVGLLLLLGVYSLGWLYLAGRGEVSRRAAFLITAGVVCAWLAAIAILAGYQLVPVITDFFDDTLLNKLDSDSGVERMGWNMQALRNFTDTFGIGAGLGSVRASNWFVSCLGSIGVIGTGLYLAFLGSVARAPAVSGNVTRDCLIQSLKIGCLAIIVSALPTAPTPNLGTFFFILAGLCVGLSRSIVVTAPAAVPRRGPRTAPARAGVAR